VHSSLKTYENRQLNSGSQPQVEKALLKNAVKRKNFYINLFWNGTTKTENKKNKKAPRRTFEPIRDRLVNLPAR
jgi:hypothetical protein